MKNEDGGSVGRLISFVIIVIGVVVAFMTRDPVYYPLLDSES